jgi:hypothetical protein
MRRGFLVALVVVVVANLLALAGVARNRSGPPDAILLLDERELELLPADRESSVLQLRLRYQNASRASDPRALDLEGALAQRFMTEARLRAVGFDCSVPVDSARAAAFYRTALRRPGVVVFELGGSEWERRVAAWQARERQRIDAQVASGALTGDAVARARMEVDEAPRRMSRLMPVDAGRDAAALRQAYPDRERFLILRAVFRLEFVEPREPGGPSLHGHLVEALPFVLDVPRVARGPLDAFRDRSPLDRRVAPPGRPGGWALRMLDHAPRYEVRLSVGRSLQPWVEQVRPLP